MPGRVLCGVWNSVVAAAVFAAGAASGVEVKVDRYDPQSGIDVRRDGDLLRVEWSADERRCRVEFDMTGKAALLRELSTVRKGTTPPTPRPIVEHVDPALYLTIGTRERPRGNSPQFPHWVFFDNPAKRSHQIHRSKLDLQSVEVESRGKRTIVRIGDLTIGSFRGAWEFTFFDGSPLVKVEAVASTDEPSVAVVYDLGLVGNAAPVKTLYWREPRGEERRLALDSPKSGGNLSVRYRTLIADTGNWGSLAVFPPPHQFYFPRDYSDNLADLWYGVKGALFDEKKFGFGIRQAPTGGGNWVPWNNAPPGTRQRFGMFLLLSPLSAEKALDEVLRYTRGDRFEPLPNQTTFTSHYHMAVAEQAMRRSPERRETEIPEFVGVFKRMGVEILHLGEFHGDGHPKDPGPLRLPEMETMFRECRRLSDDDLLFIPGEEINEWLGKAEPGRHPGHWMSLFPRPVYWMQRRGDGDPFVVDDPKYGKVYRVGGREDMQKLIAAENGLVWSAHPRIKASSWAPDAFKDEDFFRADSWLGGAWKSMPSDLSEPRLGRRCLDLLDDMSNWGAKKYLPGEVDVFKIDGTHELYGHMNINYLRLDRAPKYDEGWQPVLDVLRRGAFFTTTGEVLIHEFSLGGKQSGETLSAEAARDAELKFKLSWTFPPEFAEVISGDGREVFRERIDLSGEREFRETTLTLRPELKGRKWLRVEAWDVAVNGAYSQPVWIDGR